MTSSLNSKSIFTVIRGLPKCLKRIQTFAYLLRSSLRGLFSLRIQLFMFLEIYDISSPPGQCWLPFDLLSLRAGPTHLDQWELSNTSGWPCWFTSLQMSVESHDGQNLQKSINNQYSFPQTCPKAQLDVDNSWIETPLPDDSSLCQIDF